MSDAHEGTRGFLASLPERDAPALLHLLTCDECTLNAVQSLGREMEEEAEGRPEPRPDYGAVFQRLEARQPGLLRALEERRAEAGALLDALLDFPAGERLRAVAAQERFHEPHLAELLLEKSAGAQPGEPRRSEELARLAYAAAVRAARRAAAEYGASLKVRACCLLGGALRLRGAFRDADRAFRQAAHHLGGPLDLPERAEFAQGLGQLRLAEGRIDEALALLWRAGYLFGWEGDFHRQGICLAWIGLLYLDFDDAERALPALRQARVALEEGEEPSLACRVRLGLALCHAAFGRRKAASRLVEEARHLYSRVKDERRLVRFYWAEGRVAARSGRNEEALDLLLAVRRKLMSTDELHDAALATLDVALVLAQRRQPGEIHPLIHELVERFPSHSERLGVLVALAAFESLALEGREDLTRARALAAAYLRRMRRGRARFEEA